MRYIPNYPSHDIRSVATGATVKLLATFSIALLCLIMGVAMAAHSQEPRSDEGKPEEAHPKGAQEAHPEGHPAAQAEHPEGAHPEAHPEANPAARTPAANTHEARPEARPQQEHPPEARPPQEGHQAAPPNHEARPPEQQHRTAAPPPSANARPEPTARPANEPSHTAEHRVKAPTPEQQRNWEQHRVANWQAEHHTWQQRGGYRGYRVPQNRYNMYFGAPHVFRIYQYPVTFVSGYPRFQYGGYWVQVLDPWPNYWANNWFYTDPVYVEYLDGGYYLVDTRYPGVLLAVQIFG